MRFLLTFLLITLTSASVVVLRPPLGLDIYMPVPPANPLTHDKITLGRKLFFDKRLSRDGTLACASCHDPKLAFSDGKTVARGIHGAEGTRNAPALINRGYGNAFFWDGRADSLEHQALQPILNPIELGLTQPELERRTGMTAAAVTEALACHIGPNLTDEKFHNTGVAWRDGRLADEGRFVVSGNVREHGAFKTPTLRDVARTAPYMHDGNVATLEDVIEFYSEGGRPNPNLDPEIRPRHFTPEEKRSLAAFLRSLTGHIREGI